VNIKLYYLGGLLGTIVSNTPDDGSYSWTLPSSFANYGDSYRIRVEDYNNPSTYGMSPAYFEIPEPDSITVTNPTASSSWQVSTTHNILWDSTGSISSVNIKLYYLGGLLGTIVSNTPDDGSYSWTLPSSFANYGDSYRIRVEDYNNPSTYGMSPAYFEIPEPDSITVTNPTASSSWQVSTTHNILWDSTGSISSVNIKLYYLGGLLGTIVSNTPDDGSYSWTLPSSFANYGDSYRIRVEDYNNPSTYGLSPAYFEIPEPDSITVTNPTASSSWQVSTMHNIQWDSTGSISSVNIKLYYLGGLLGTIVSNTPDDGSYSWTLPSSFANYGDSYQIRVEDYNNPSTYGISPAYFEILGPETITVTSPTASSSWQVDTTHAIQWTSTGSISSVNIKLYYLGNFHSTIVTNTPDDGYYSWTLPSSFANYGDSYQIRIEDYSNPSTYGMGPAYFEILGADSITVTSPTASSSWQVSTTHNIQWDSTGSISSVTIELYYLGGFHSTIISNTPDDGSYNWMLPTSFANYGDSYQILIEDYSNPSTYGMSPAYFEIPEPDSITVTSPTASSSWQVSTTHNIQWSSTGSISSVTIELYYLGSYLSTIVTNTPDDGSYNWMLPASFSNYGDVYQIRVEDYNDPSTYDMSTAYFEILSDDTEDEEPFIPGYHLFILIGLLFGVSVVLIRNRIKKTKNKEHINEL